MLGEKLRRSIPEIIIPFRAVNSEGKYSKFAFSLDYEMGEYRIDALVKLVCASIVHFALTPEEIEKLNSQKDYGAIYSYAWSRISEAMKEKKGDYGEVLLYLITEYYLEAPKLVTKVFLKSGKKDQVKGFDCAHFSFVDEELTLFLGEAKLHKSFSGGLSSAIKSLEEHCTRDFLNDEFSLLLPHVKINEVVNEALYNKVLPILNRAVSLDKVNICVPILLAFDAEEIRKGSSLEDKEHIERLRKMFATKYLSIEKSGLSNLKAPKVTFQFMLLPFSSIDEFREKLDHFEGAMKQCL